MFLGERTDACLSKSRNYVLSLRKQCVTTHPARIYDRNQTSKSWEDRKSSHQVTETRVWCVEGDKVPQLLHFEQYELCPAHNGRNVHQVATLQGMQEECFG